MASVGASLDSAIAGIQKGVEQARIAGAKLGEHTQKLQESASSSAEKPAEGKGSIIDVTA
jgi:hypothetical protein